MKNVSIIGAGPAGLAAAYEFLRQKKLHEYHITIFETENSVGGLAKTIVYKGSRFDLGGHRFYTKYPEIKKFYNTFLGKSMLKRKRLSRIYYNKKLFRYPLSASNALKNLGIKKSLLILGSYIHRQSHRYKKERTFNQWVANRFGDKLFTIFFKSYTQKVWGIPTNKLSAQWAAQRIQNFNLFTAVINAVFKINPGAKTITTKFSYPKYGPGMLYEKMKKILQKKGIRVLLNHQVINFSLVNDSIISLEVLNNKSGKREKFETNIVISTMPFNKLIALLQPPKMLHNLLKDLQFRNFISVNLLVRSNPFPDQWIYIHDPDVKVGRIQNFRNWSSSMAKRKTTPISMEYFASEGDALWSLDNKALLSLAKKEIVQLGLIQKSDIIDGFVQKVSDAYPLYDFDYEKPLEKGKKFINKFTNLYLCGRGGLFRYNNQDHSILTGFYVARNIISGINVLDVWNVNEGNEYLEK